MSDLAKTIADSHIPAAGYKYEHPPIPSCLRETSRPGGFKNHHRILRPGTNTTMTIAHTCNPKITHLTRYPIANDKRFKNGKLMLLTKFARSAFQSTNPVVKKLLACISNARHLTTQQLCASQKLGHLLSRPHVNTPLCGACAVIYTIFNIHTGAIYVGQSLRQPSSRFFEHLKQARCVQNGTINDQVESRFYRQLALDHRAWRMFIVDQIPLTQLDLTTNESRRLSFARIASPLELKWINRLRSSSTYKLGMNSAHSFMYEHRPKRNHSLPNSMQHNRHNNGGPNPQPIVDQNVQINPVVVRPRIVNVVNRGGALVNNRTFGFRDDLRRIKYIHRIVTGNRSPEQNRHSLAAYISSFSAKTTTRMLSFLMRKDADNIIAQHLPLGPKRLCITLLRKSPLLPPMRPPLLVIAHKSPLHNSVDFKAILKKASLSFPQAPGFPNSFATPRVTFAYHQPLGQRLDNRSCFKKASTPNQYSLTTCMCTSHEFRSFSSKKVGHVLTSDLNFIRLTSLRLKLTVGASYRHPPTETPACAKTEFYSALNKYCDKLHVSNHLPTGFFDVWILSCLRIYDSNKVVRSFTQGNVITTCQPAIEPTKPLFFTRKEQSYLNYLRRYFIISSPDKSANAFAFTCKAFYFHQAKEQLTDRLQYNVINNNALGIILRRTKKIVDDNIAFKTTRNKLQKQAKTRNFYSRTEHNHFDTQYDNTSNMPPKNSSFIDQNTTASFKLLPKLHKQKVRPVSSAPLTLLTPISKMLAILLSFLKNDRLPTVWSNLFDTKPANYTDVEFITLQSLKFAPFSLESSESLASRLHALNNDTTFGTLPTKFVFTCGDVQEMYTSIPCSQATISITQLIHMFWLPGKDLFYNIKTNDVSWHQSDFTKTSYVRFTRDDLINAMKTVFSSAVIGFDGVVYLQKRIPQGDNASSIAADLTCILKELLWLQDVIMRKSFPLIRLARTYFRQADDLLHITQVPNGNDTTHKFTSDIFTDSVLTCSTPGMYPPYIRVIWDTPTTELVTHCRLDVLNTRQHTRLKQRIIDYRSTDKRTKFKFETLPFCTYPRPTSGISNSHKLNIISSELNIYSKLCNRRKYFIYRAAMLIYEFWRLGYKSAPLFAKAMLVLQKLTPLYGVHSAQILLSQIYWRVVLFCRTGVATRDEGPSAPYAVDPFTVHKSLTLH